LGSPTFALSHSHSQLSRLNFQFEIHTFNRVPAFTSFFSNRFLKTLPRDELDQESIIAVLFTVVLEDQFNILTVGFGHSITPGFRGNPIELTVITIVPDAIFVNIYFYGILLSTRTFFVDFIFSCSILNSNQAQVEFL
jgi:hypothetical protein